MNMTTSVAERSSTVAAMMKASAPVADILKGGAHMRAKGEVYLPRFSVEDETDYKARVASTWLFNGTKKFRDDTVGRVFAKPIVLADKEGHQLEDWCNNVDMEGRDLSNFAKDVFEGSLTHGLSFIMADAPPKEEGQTAGAVMASGWRPYLVPLTLEQVLGWKWELVSGVPVLTQFRIMERVADPDRDEYSDDTIQQVRILTVDPETGRVGVELYRAGAKDGSWSLYQEYATDFDQIYVAPVCTGRKGFLLSESPLTEMAELNLAHWRVQSDKSNCLHKSLSPLLFLKQMGKIGENGEAIVSSSYGFMAESDNADMRWVEVTGGGIALGSIELAEIQDQMKQMGLQIISERVASSTATGDSIDEGKSVTRIRMWADDLKDSLEIALGWMADIAGMAGVSTDIEVNKDFGILGNLPLSEVKDMYLAGVISKATYINEAKRRGVLDEAVNADDEAEMSEGEGLDQE